MKKLGAGLLILISSLIASVQSAGLKAEDSRALSPAEKSIAQAKEALVKKPGQYGTYNALAMALARRARETSDISYYVQAEEALKQSFGIAPDNFEGQKVQGWLLLGRHEFSQALEAAKALNRRAPDDVLVYGFLMDANAELGNYKDAEVAAQWMLDLRPGNLPGITRAAYLRELFGDVDGALELMHMAYESTSPTELEDRAWILTQMAHLKLTTGNLSEAEALLQQALALFPNYHYALGNLAKVRLAQKRNGEAVELFERRYAAAAHAENLYDLAQALELAGRFDQARTKYAEFEQKSLLESKRTDNSNRELIFYYADYARKPAEALSVARQEYARRHDVFTLDAYAWALHVNSQDSEARKQIETALAVGVRDAKIYYHAGEIAKALSDSTAAERYLKLSVDLNSVGSEQARLALLGRGVN